MNIFDLLKDDAYIFYASLNQPKIVFNLMHINSRFVDKNFLTVVQIISAISEHELSSS